MGQAVGTAAAIAVAHATSPGGVLDYIEELQQELLADDCYLPWVRQRTPALTAEAEISASQGDPEPVRDGFSRRIGQDPHGWLCRAGDWIVYSFDAPRRVGNATMVFDSALDRNITLTLHHQIRTGLQIPGTIPKRFRIEGLSRGEWRTIHQVEDNHQRFVRLPVLHLLDAVRLTVEEMWGGEETVVYAFYVD
jgi:hypothetical protein